LAAFDDGEIKGIFGAFEVSEEEGSNIGGMEDTVGEERRLGGREDIFGDCKLLGKVGEFRLPLLIGIVNKVGGRDEVRGVTMMVVDTVPSILCEVVIGAGLSRGCSFANDFGAKLGTEVDGEFSFISGASRGPSDTFNGFLFCGKITLLGGEQVSR